MLYNLNTVSGAKTHLRLILVQNPESAPPPQVCLTLKTGTETLHLTPDTFATDEFIIPPLVTGRYSYELLIAEHPTLHGALVVRPSALSGHPAECTADIRIDLPCILVSLTQGPRGLKGERGFSAYEIATQNGYLGSESEWVAELKGSQTAATAAKEQATEAGKQAAAAADSAKAAANSATAAGNQAKAASDSATEAGKQAKAAADYADTAGKQAEAAAGSATTASEQATEAGKQAEAAAGSASTASEQATEAGKQAKAAADYADTAGKQAEAAAGSATTASEQATAAANSAAAAKSTLADAAKLADNNTFYGVNTFNGSFVANGPTKLTAQTTVDGTSMQDLLEMQTALSSFLAGIGELSLETQLQPGLGCHAETWDEWTAANPNWAQQDTLIFYAPFAKVGTADMTSNKNVATSAVKKSLWISPMLPSMLNSNDCLKKALGSNISLYCPASGTLRGVMNMYHAKKITVITPDAEVYNSFIPCFGFMTGASNNAMHIYAPELQSIAYAGEINTTFSYMPILTEFSIYAPKLTTSFYFSYATNHDTDGDGYVQGQTCAVLQALIAGIGKPETEQTITTSTPQGTADEIAALDAAAAAKNWKFEYVKVKKQS